MKWKGIVIIGLFLVIIFSIINNSKVNFEEDIPIEELLESENLFALTGFPHGKIGIGEAPPYIQEIIFSLLKQCEFTTTKELSNNYESEFTLKYFVGDMTEDEFVKSEIVYIYLNQESIELKVKNTGNSYICIDENISSVLHGCIFEYAKEDIDTVTQLKGEQFKKLKLNYGYSKNGYLSQEECEDIWGKQRFDMILIEEYEKILMDIQGIEDGIILYGSYDDSNIWIHLLEKYIIIKDDYGAFEFYKK